MIRSIKYKNNSRNPAELIVRTSKIRGHQQFIIRQIMLSTWPMVHKKKYSRDSQANYTYSSVDFGYPRLPSVAFVHVSRAISPMGERVLPNEIGFCAFPLPGVGSPLGSYWFALREFECQGSLGYSLASTPASTREFSNHRKLLEVASSGNRTRDLPLQRRQCGQC